MTTREKVLSLLLGGFIVVAGLGFLYYLFIYTPLSQLEGSIAGVQEELERKQGELRRERTKNKSILETSPRLGHWQVLSLAEPATKEPHRLTTFQDDLHRVYARILDGIFRKAGFDSDHLVVIAKDPPKPAAQGVRGAVGGAGAPAVRGNTPKGPPYTPLNYTVVAVGTYDKLLAAMRDYHQAPVLHQIKSMVLEKPDPPRPGQGPLDLKLTLNVEVLQVQGAEKFGVKGRDLIAEEGRIDSQTLLPSQYADLQPLLKYNMFLGKPPERRKPERLAEGPVRVEPPREVVRTPDPPAPKPKEEPRDVLGVVKLVQITHNGRRWEAFYYDQATGLERLLTLGSRNSFEFKDKYENLVLEGEVVNISSTRGIYYQAADGKIYHWGLGEFLYDSTRRPVEVVAIAKKAIHLKGLEEIDGIAVMSYGDVYYTFAPQPAVAYGMGVGLAGIPTPKAAGAAPVAATASRE